MGHPPGGVATLGRIRGRGPLAGRYCAAMTRQTVGGMKWSEAERNRPGGCAHPSFAHRHPISLPHTALQVLIFSVASSFCGPATLRPSLAQRFGASAAYLCQKLRKALCSKLSSPSACISVPSFFWSRVQSFIVSIARNDLFRADIPCPTHHRGAGLCLVDRKSVV